MLPPKPDGLGHAEVLVAAGDRTRFAGPRVREIARGGQPHGAYPLRELLGPPGVSTRLGDAAQEVAVALPLDGALELSLFVLAQDNAPRSGLAPPRIDNGAGKRVELALPAVADLRAALGRLQR